MGTPITRRTGIALAAAGAVALLLVGATIGLLLSGRIGSSAAATTPVTDSVDAGFARDMIVHHDQGVLMAHYAELNTTDDEISVMAYDIGATQSDQAGQMKGWLSLWDLPEFSTGPHMAWMADGGNGGHDMAGMATTSAAATGAASSDPASGSTGTDGALMPGMATDAQIDQLRTARGEASDILFLQLMIRHHQGGLPMMEYAAQHAESTVVANFAAKMADAQESEISVMTQMLAARGAQPLPAP